MKWDVTLCSEMALWAKSAGLQSNRHKILKKQLVFHLKLILLSSPKIPKKKKVTSITYHCSVLCEARVP